MMMMMVKVSCQLAEVCTLLRLQGGLYFIVTNTHIQQMQLPFPYAWYWQMTIGIVRQHSKVHEGMYEYDVLATITVFSRLLISTCTLEVIAIETRSCSCR